MASPLEGAQGQAFMRSLRDRMRDALSTTQALQLEQAQRNVRVIQVDILNALGTVVLERFDRTRDRGDLERSIGALESALALMPTGLGAPPDLVSNFGVARGYRFAFSEDRDDLDADIALQHEAARTEEAAPLDAKTRRLHQFLVRLANAYVARFDAVGGFDDIRDAVAAAQAAVRAAHDERGDLPLAQNVLGRTLHLAARKFDEGAFDGAIEAFGSAHELAPNEPEYASNLATALHESVQSRPEDPRRRGNLRRALWIRHRLVKERADTDAGCAARLNNLGQSVLLAYTTTKRRELHRIALSLFRRAEELDEKDARFTLNTVLALEATAAEDQSSRNLISHGYRRALRRARAQADELVLQASTRWVDSSIAASRWSDAIEAAATGHEALRRLYERQRSRNDKLRWLGTASGFAVATAYALAREGNPRAAAATVESVRSFLLADAVPGGADAEFPPTQGEDTAAFEAQLAQCHRPVVYLGTTAAGGLALIARGSAVSVVWLPLATTDALFLELGVYAPAYKFWADSPKDFFYRGWAAALERMTTWLGATVMNPLLEHLGNDDSAVLIPVGSLALLPLHAARPIDGDSVLEHLTLSYAPSAAVYARALAQSSARRESRALIVSEPKVESQIPLPAAAAETAAVKAAFEDPLILPGRAATLDRVESARNS